MVISVEFMGCLFALLGSSIVCTDLAVRFFVVCSTRVSAGIGPVPKEYSKIKCVTQLSGKLQVSFVGKHSKLHIPPFTY